MKQFASILVVLVLLTLPSIIHAQNSTFAGKQVTLYNHSLIVSDAFQLQLEDLVEDLFSSDAMDERDPMKKKLIDPIYTRVKTAFEAKTAMQILPKETLEGKVNYDAYDYPVGSRKKAVKVGSTPYYLKLDIQITAPETLSNSLTVNGNGLNEQQIKAHVAINTTLFDNNGKVVFKANGKAKSQDWIVINEASLFGGFMEIDMNNFEEQENSLMTVLDAAIEDMKTKLP